MAAGGGEFLIVAAIDFGTAYSGYAFSFRHTFQEDPTKVITNNWPAGTGGLLSLKTSSCALFDPQKKFHSFGYEAEDKYSDLALDEEHLSWYFFKHFKMDLYEKVKLNRGFKIEDTLGRTMPAVDIFSNSIGYLKQHLLKTCRDKIPNTQDDDIRWVLTVPAIWDDAAKQFMREAASKAGIPDSHLLIALEPEAASLCCKYLPIDKLSGADGSFSPFKPGSKYMVLDAGGGTVDITVHEVKDDHSLSEIHKAGGGNWGGTYVDKAFKTFLSNIIGNNVMEAFIKEQTLDYVELFRSFEVKKRGFQTRVTDKVMFKVPVSMNETHVKLKKKKNIKDILQTTQYAGQISWAGDKVRISADIVNSFFDEPCDKIVKHLEKLFTNPQVDEVDFILMVGGFSESLMLQEYIREAFPDKRVIVPNEAGLAVLKGAVIFGHDTKAISERKAKFTYGVETSLPFVHGKHPDEKMFFDDGDHCLCENIFNIHVKIGSTITTGEANEAQSYFVTGEDQTAFTFNVFASKKRKPKFTTDPGCILIGSLEVDAPGYGLGRSAEVQLMFGDTELHVHAVNEHGEETSAKFDFLSGDGDQDGSDDGSDDLDSDSDDDQIYGDDQQVLDFLVFESDYDSSDSNAAIHGSDSESD